MKTRLCSSRVREYCPLRKLIWFRPVAVTLALVLALCSLSARVQAQADDFEDGNDAGWSHYDPLGAVAQSPKATYNAASHIYRIQAQPFTAAGNLGPARSASLRHDVSYSKFYMSVDLVNWDNAQDQAFGFLARITLIDPMIAGLPTGTNGPGAVNGYTLDYLNFDHNFEINRVTREVPSNIGRVSVTLDPANDYRFVFTGDGPTLVGRIYLLSDLSTPLVTVTASDGTYFSGVNGLFVYNNQDTAHPADATFDNFFADTAAPPSLALEFNFGEELLLRWPPEPPGYVLQCVTNLNPPRFWSNITENVVAFPDYFLYMGGVEEKHKFFRLKKSF
jgi:hypothetical protein